MGVGWGLRVEVEVLDDERTSTPAIFKGPRAVSHPTCCSASLDRCDRCDLLVGLEGFHLMSMVRTPDALVLDVEWCNQLAGCRGCGLNRTRPRSYGGEGNRRAHGFMTSSPDGSRVAAPTPTTPAAWATVALEAKYFSSTLPRIYNMSHLLLSPGFTIAS